MSDDIPTIEVHLRLISTDEMDDWSSLSHFIELYDQFKEELHAESIIESFTIPGEFYFIVESVDTHYEDGEIEGEDNYLGFIVVTPRRFGEQCIEFIWIKQDFRRKSYATEAIKLLQIEKLDVPWYDYAHTEDAEEFWKTTGLKPMLIKNERGSLEFCEEAKLKNDYANEMRRQTFLKMMEGDK